MEPSTEDNVALLMLIGIVGMLILAVSIILFFVFYQKRLLAQQNVMQQLELDAQKQSLASFIQAQESERKRIAQELHDGIGAQLSAAKLYVNRLPNKEEAGKIGFIKSEAGQLIDDTIDDIRRITRNLLPTNLERFGLAAALEDLCKQINDAGELNIYLDCPNKERINEEQAFALYRILQELLNNTLKYAEASRVDIGLIIEPDRLELSYQDNGKGFDLANWRKDATLQNGLGLRGIETRASVLGASIDMNSEPGKGIQVFIKLSLVDRSKPALHPH